MDQIVHVQIAIADLAFVGQVRGFRQLHTPLSVCGDCSPTAPASEYAPLSKRSHITGGLPTGYLIATAWELVDSFPKR